MLLVRGWICILAVSCCCCCCCVLHAVAYSTDPTEVSALLSVKHDLIDTWMHLKNWNKGDPCVSKWTGVQCFDKVGDHGYLNVRELQLLNMNLSGSLSPELGKLSRLQILDFMWNQINGTIPKEIGNLSSLRVLVLNGNRLSGPLPDELGYLSNLNRLQVDENYITGPIPKSFANLSRVEHLHMNNNSISGHLPSELSSLPRLLHLLVDNNNLSGLLPPEYSDLTTLTILQLDNNQFVGAEIPKSYGNYPRLVKLSLRNCSLGGALPDFSQISNLSYLDLSWNELTGPIPSAKLSDNITTIIFSHNHLNGSVPSTFSLLPRLQMLSLDNNSLTGSIPSSIWSSSKSSPKVVIDVRYNQLSGISGDLNPSENVSLRLRGNPLCKSTNIENSGRFCDTDAGGEGTSSSNSTDSSMGCPLQECPLDFYFEYVPSAPVKCYCAAPIRIGYRLKSPSFDYNFPARIHLFEFYVTQALNLDLYELVIDSYEWETGPRLRMYLKIFPMIGEGSKFNDSEVSRIRDVFARWEFPGSDFFGPYELLNFTLLGPYESVGHGRNGINKGVLAAIVVGAIAFAAAVSTIATIIVVRKSKRYIRMLSQERLSAEKVSIKIEGVREFSFKEMALATDNFNSLAQVGRGGYGRVYKGVLSDSTIVAIKRAEDGSLQGMREFLTEIQLLSRLHHRNLVALMGYCGEDGEQMLIYEFMPNGTLREWLSGKRGESLSFITRIRMALGSAKGILYLHTEANPPIFHRDIKASNILLDSHMNAKVADFGLSRLAPVLDDDGFLPDYVSTVVKGTPGYLDPEYFLTHKLTAKSDVYSLGVVFMELITALPPILHGKNLVREVVIARNSGKMSSMIDKQMGGNYPAECMDKFTVLALRCCEDDPDIRPSMLEVVRELEDILQLSLGSSGLLLVSGTSSSWYSGSSSGDPSSSSSANIKMTSLDVSRGGDLTTGEFKIINPR